MPSACPTVTLGAETNQNPRGRPLAGPARTAALDQELADLARRHDHGAGTTIMDWEYLLLTARKQP